MSMVEMKVCWSIGPAGNTSAVIKFTEVTQPEGSATLVFEDDRGLPVLIIPERSLVDARVVVNG